MRRGSLSAWCFLITGTSLIPFKQHTFAQEARSTKGWMAWSWGNHRNTSMSIPDLGE